MADSSGSPGSSSKKVVVRLRLQLSGATSCAGSFSGKLQAAGRGGGLQAAVLEPRGSKVEDFGLETEPTSANLKNQTKFQVSGPPAVLPHSGKKLDLPLP